jgi:hypothetical protein
MGFIHDVLLGATESAVASAVGRVCSSIGGFGVLISSLQTTATSSSPTMIVNDSW